MPASQQGSPLSTRPTGRYTLIPRSLIFLTRGEKWLLLKGAAHKRLWANRYNGVGGHIEPGEHVLSAARRELREETGLEADLWLCAVITIDAGENRPGIGLFVFRGECPHGDPVPSPEGQLEWFTPAQIASLPVVEDLNVLLPRLMALRPGAPVFFLQYAYDQQNRLIITE